MKRPEIDLTPAKWKPEGDKPREPILGPGAAPFARELILIAAALGLVFLVLTLAPNVNNAARGVLLGGSTPAATSYTWTPERGLERKN